MKVKVLEEKLRSGGYNLVKDDTITVNDELGERWCSLGWAEDVDGNVPTGQRNLTPQRIQPDKLKVSTKARKKGE